MLSIRHFGSNPIRDSEDLQEQVTRLSSTVQMFQDWGHRSDDRLSKLESSVSCIQGSVRELKEKCKLLETKLKLQELREERLEILAVALERFFDENSVIGAESERVMSTRRRRSERKRNLDKLMATEKCRPDLDFPGRVKTPVKSPVPVPPLVVHKTVKTPVKSPVPVPPLVVHKTGKNPSVSNISQEIITVRTRDTKGEKLVENEHRTLTTIESQPKEVVKHITEISRLSEQTRNETLDMQGENGKVRKNIKESFVCGSSNSIASKKRKSVLENVVEHVNQNQNINSEKIVGKSKQGDLAPYKCSYCTKPFWCKHSCREHELAHVTGKLKCSLCDYESDFRRGLKGHVARVHDVNSNMEHNSISLMTKSNSPTRHKKKKKILKIKLPMTPNKSSKSVEPAHNHITSASFPLNNGETSENSVKASLSTPDPLTQSSLSTTSSTNTLMKNDDQINSEPPRKKKKKMSKNISRINSSLSSINSQENRAPELLDSTTKKIKKFRENKLSEESYSSAAATSSADIQQPQESLKEAVPPPSSDPAEVHACPFCSKTCRNISKLEKHLLRKH
ncbi:unnamed protein product [Allacma fusca]|uniref:C2H2-type domain-containing protein n=1 Tax=Allacma fusca TaxID=39272 RepID=A0A8J2LSH2_9HEXA|nr:unnamed protein product [Allacma fusca]